MDSQLEGFLNSLAEAERAGGRVLHELTGLAHSLELCEMLKKVGHDEGYYAGELAHRGNDFALTSHAWPAACHIEKITTSCAVFAQEM